jgi:AMP nucleosidase
MKTKNEIVENWLPRYTGLNIDGFGQYILLTNFNGYVKMFAEKYGVPIVGMDKSMPCATHDNITIINFGMGSANACTIMDLLSALGDNVKACLFLGKCGSLKHSAHVGDLILPIGAISNARDEAYQSYFPPEVPALPAFALQKAVSTTIREYGKDYRTGTVFTTNRRVWEHDEAFKQYLHNIRAMAIDMETATLFSVGFYNSIPTGALLLVSDEPMTPEGVKTEKSDAIVTTNFVDTHLNIGIDSLKQIRDNKETVKHLLFQ